MSNVWLASSVWLALALAASIISIRVAISVALIEIIVGAIAGNTIGLEITPWVNFLAGFGAILLTFLAGTEIEMQVIRNNLGASVGIGVVGFFAPYVGVLAYAHYAIGWSWPEAQIAGISLSTTSVAVVYAVMVETGFNKTELGKIILAACFINDLGTVLALGIVFAHFDVWLAFFGAAMALTLWFLPRFAPWFFGKAGHRVSEPEAKFVSLVLLSLGGLSQVAGSEAVLPAYLIGMALAPTFLKDQELGHRFRIIAFTILDALLFSEGGFSRLIQRCHGFGRSDRGVPFDQDGDQIHRNPASDQAFQFRAQGRDVYDAADVDRADLREHLRAFWSHQSHHRSARVYNIGDRRDRQRRGPDPYRPEVVHANTETYGSGCANV